MKLLDPVRNYLFGSLRGQLIFGVALTHAVLMTIFIVDLTHRQQVMLLERQREQTLALTQSLATTSAVWLAANDVIGLQELVDAQRRYPNLVFALLTNADGRVLAHTDKGKIGLTVLDLPESPQTSILSAGRTLVDVAVPVALSGKIVGWARVGTDLGETSKLESGMAVGGAFYALAAILIGSAMAWWLGLKVTRRLYAIEHTVDAVHAGRVGERTRLGGTDEAARLAGAFDTMLDTVTARERELRDNQVELQKLNEHLEETVEKRTQELRVALEQTLRHQTELVEAKEAAEAAAKAKGEFLAVMSHELRTPLNGVLGFAELLILAGLHDEQRQYAENIASSGKHLLSVVNDILDFSSIERGRMVLDDMPINISGLLVNASRPVEKLARQKGIGFENSIDNDVPHEMMGDSRRLLQILINLLGNAVKFTSQGSVGLRVRRAAGGMIEFVIEDSGPGIAPEVQAMLFKPFTQGDSSISRRFQGTGLGLAISQRLAGLMGGAVTVTSKEGSGSVFTLRLPLRTADGTRQEQAPTPTVANSALPCGPERTVLVVEDDAVNRKLAGRMLAKLGYKAELAESGPSAIAVFAPGKFQAILMDIRMPEMDGLEVTRRIRSLESETRVPIIALTANVMPGDRERFLAAGMDEFLSKPCTIDGLAEKLSVISERTSRG